MPTEQLTIFSWGYYGWGNATPQLLQAVDAVETARGFEPPIFVDTRIRRSVRARGFNGSAFEKLLGTGRHKWMRSLGNKAVLDRDNRDPLAIELAEPQAAAELFDFALSSAAQNRRLLFFCSCQWPQWDRGLCHRTEIARLLLGVADKRGLGVQVVEWPGGDPEHIDLETSPEIFSAVRKGRKTIPLKESVDLQRMAELPWGSIATLRARGEEVHRVVGPAIRQQETWALPVLATGENREVSIDECRKDGARLRRAHRLQAASARAG